jgi:transglutaminase-like putative cysteine protease
MNLEAYRTTKARALDDTEAVELDLGWDFSVPVDRRLTNPSSTRQIRYRVQLEDSDPAAVFVSGPTQQVRPVDDHTAEIVVTAARPAPDDSQAADDTQSPAHDRPTSADLEPNSLIQSDDPAIVAMAEEAAGEATDPWQAALAFERYVSEHISSKGFSQAFATAAEVAKTKSGDCTEHAVLLAALARARGIPARVAVGLVYMPGAQAMGYHMWNELYVEGRWIPMDATLARGGTGAARLKLAHSNLEGTSAYASFLPAVQIVGRLKVEILDVE